MPKTFSAQVDDIVKATKERMLAVAQDATVSVIEEAQTPVAKGGKMRVDTGFLRASGQASLNGLPTGPTRLDEGSPTEQDVNLIIGQATLENSVWFGWTANYARYREVYDGFLESAVQNWQKHVNTSVAKLRNQIG